MACLQLAGYRSIQKYCYGCSKCVGTVLEKSCWDIITAFCSQNSCEIALLRLVENWKAERDCKK